MVWYKISNKSIGDGSGLSLSDFPKFIGSYISFGVFAVIFLGSFIAALVAGSLIFQPQSSKAATGLPLVGAPTITMASSSNSLGLNPMPSANSGLASSSHTITTNTNVPTGYQLAISTPVAPALATTQGTITSPVALANNTWGYALANAGAVGVQNGFDASYTSPTPALGSKWANPSAMPVIKNTATAASNDQTTIYYGAKVDMNLKSGTYTNTVRYTAVANITNIPAPTITSITPSSGTTAGGTNIAIVGTGFTANNQSVTTTVTIGGKACQNPSISSNTPTAGKDTIYCATPAGPSAGGGVNIVVTTWKSTASRANGYTYEVPIASMQEMTPDTCPSTRTLAYDARDNATYWVQKLADGKCWMLTNLAYAGGGNNTYGDVKAINLVAGGMSFDSPMYGVPAGSNRTVKPAAPSTSTDGTGQYGYLYNFCGATGGQIGTIACRNAMDSIPGQYPGISICPSGWELPTANELSTLNNTINGSTKSDAGLRSTWLAMYGGWWESQATYQGQRGYYWSSDRYNELSGESLFFTSSKVYGSTTEYRISKTRGAAVRCIASHPKTKTGDAIQTVTTDSCPAVRTRVYDARDYSTYWVQEMPDGRCWMLTNLAYEGGGTNTYGDVKNITFGNYQASYATPYFYRPPGDIRTTGVMDPSTSTTGIGQYGILYNWCAAMGAQANTHACSNANTNSVPYANEKISICPSGWRLPSSNPKSESGEIVDLIDAVGAWAASTNNKAHAQNSNLRNQWLAVYGGSWIVNDGYKNQGNQGAYWSSSRKPGDSNIESHYLGLGHQGTNSYVNFSYSQDKQVGLSVRCIAN